MYLRKKKINLINFKKDNNKFHKKLINKNFYIGPWCLEKISLENENFNNILNLYENYMKNIKQILKKLKNL